MRHFSHPGNLLKLCLCILLGITACSDDDMMLIPGTIPAEFETSLQRLGYPYTLDGGGGAYHPLELVIQFDPGLSIVEIEDFLFNVMLAQSYTPCMCGDVIILAHFDPETLDQQGGLEGAKISGESEDEIEEISFNYYNEMEVFTLAGSTLNTGDFNAAIESADVVIGMVDAGVDFFGTSGPMFGRLHTTDTDNITGTDDDGNCLVDDYLGWDFVNEDNDPTDDHSHGTHITNLINTQLKAYDAEFAVDFRSRSAFFPVKTHDLNGISTLFNVSCGIIYAADHGADIINTSWGFYALNEARVLEIAIQYAYDNFGTIFVSSTGNEAQNLEEIKHYPSEYDYPYIFKVGSMNLDFGLADFSNYYPKPTINLLAPGVNVESIMPEWHNTSVAEKSGTSISAPYIAAALAYTILKCGSQDPTFLRNELATNFPSENIQLNASELTVRKAIPDNFSACP